MKVFAIADLHLSRSGEKPMDIFGPDWRGHEDKIAENWREIVSDEDLVLIPGDLSWAMKLPQAMLDLRFIQSLPGEKVFIRGNHDYWFAGPAKVRAVLGPRVRLVRFDACVVGGVGICGVRGWLWPGHSEYNAKKDEKYWQRELKRLKLSLTALGKLKWDIAVAMFHYPPLDAEQSSEVCAMIREAGVRYAVYGHLHGQAIQGAFDGERDGVEWLCVSADKVNFAPALLLEHA